MSVALVWATEAFFLSFLFVLFSIKTLYTWRSSSENKSLRWEDIREKNPEIRTELIHFIILCSDGTAHIRGCKILRGELLMFSRGEILGTSLFSLMYSCRRLSWIIRAFGVQWRHQTNSMEEEKKVKPGIEGERREKRRGEEERRGKKLEGIWRNPGSAPWSKAKHFSGSNFTIPPYQQAPPTHTHSPCHRCWISELRIYGLLTNCVSIFLKNLSLCQLRRLKILELVYTEKSNEEFHLTSLAQ